jgi:hypothetical protein
MSKFMVQLMLSVMVGVSAALGFNPHIKSQLHETWQGASTFLHQTTKAVIDTAGDLTAKVNAGISVKATSQASTKDSGKVEVNVNSNLKANSGNGDSLLDNLLPDFSVNNSLTNQTQTRVETDASGLDVGLKDNAKSTLNIGLGSGK